MRIDDQLSRLCVTKLAEQGIRAVVICDESTDGEYVLSVPELECKDGGLSQSRTYMLISEILEDSPGSGLLVRNPITGAVVGIFCHHPDTFMPASDGADVEFWSATENSEFSWNALGADSSNWFDGWPMDGCESIGQRIAFLSAVMTREVVSLPVVGR